MANDPSTQTPPAPPADRGPFTFAQVFHEELRRLRPGVFTDAGAGTSASASAEDAHEAELRRLYTRVHTGLDGAEGSDREPLAALCFSGGGIRSATFNLGVLQALARCRVLARFDYLSSVSGGSYIASWFEAWRHSAHGDVFTELDGVARPPDPHQPEPQPLDHLREYSNYLTPRTGVFSADTWTAVAVVARNLLLNWLVVLPVLAALVAVPQLALLLVQGAWRPKPWYVALAGLVLGFAAHLATFLYREAQLRHTAEVMRPRAPSAAAAARAAHRDAPGSAGGRREVVLMMAPLWISALLMAVAGMWTPAAPGPGFRGRVLICVGVWLVASPLVSWAVSVVWLRPRGAEQRNLGWELVSLLAAGSVAAAVLLFVLRTAGAWFKANPPIFIVLGIPTFLAIHLLAHTLFVAGASLAERGSGAHGPTAEMDREWWARYSGWVLVAVVAWLGVSGLVLSAPWIAKTAGAAFTRWLAGVGGVSGGTVWLAGKSSKTQSGRRDDTSGGSKVLEIVLAVAAPVFCAVIVMLLALATAAAGSAVTGHPHLLTTHPQLLARQVPMATIGAFAAMLLGLAAVGSLAAAVVNVNRFSAQAAYRNRLVRAYLGASNPRRTPDPFSGFDPADDFFLHELWDDKRAEGPRQRPMACINATLNLVSGGDKLAWQQRKAESFSMTPLFCGNFHDGYRRSREYGGAGGMRLGSAVAISGAAANPNMGFYSSPGVTFLLTLFNARLGAWLGNTGKPGDDTYRLPGPRWALRPLLAELFGLTNNRHPYVNLSDGGHFENLGVYEMVLRRCRYLVVCDAAADPTPTFTDLGNAIRKVRIDFGIPIEFREAIRISPREELESGLYCALATVRYSAVDGQAVDGQLIYIKPAVYGRGRETVPYDVRSYANASKIFPNESTADQWFDESQFESYRALGLHAVQQISVGCGDGGLSGFFAAVARYIGDEARKNPSAAGVAPSAAAGAEPVPDRP